MLLRKRRDCYVSFRRSIGNTAGDAECTSLAAVRCAWRMVQTRGVAATSVNSFSRVAPCRCPADASGGASTRVSPSTRCAVRKAEAEGGECSRPCFSQPRRDCDRGADAGVEVGGCHRGFGRSSGAQSQGIFASGPVTGEGSFERTKLFIERSKKRVGALREEASRAQIIVQETRGQVGFGGKCPSRWRVAVADIGAGSPRDARTTTPDSSSGFCTIIGAIEILCAGTHTGEGRSPIRIIETMVRKRDRGRPDWWPIHFKKSRLETRLRGPPIGAIVAIHQV